MVLQYKPFMTEQEYLDYEEVDYYKCEYYKGRVSRMVGATAAHNTIALNIATDFHQKFRECECEVYVSQMKVWFESKDFYTYPDIMALCGEPIFANERDDVVTNPNVIIEILSSATRIYDRIGKFELYQGLDSLQQYILVEQKKFRVESYIRQSDKTWQVQFYTKLEETLLLPTLGIELPLSRIYRKVKFPERKRPLMRPLKPSE